MPLELFVELVDTVTGIRGGAMLTLGDDAATLTATSFTQKYAMPVIGKAWMALADAVEKRQEATDSSPMCVCGRTRNVHAQLLIANPTDDQIFGFGDECKKFRRAQPETNGYLHGG